MVKAYIVHVWGRVQRVGYRRYILEVARKLRLSGYTRNEPDDSVTIFIQGREETLDKFLNMIKNPPSPAYIENVELEDAEPNNELRYFTIEYGPLEEELQEGFGGMQSIFTEYWREFREYREEFRGFAEKTDKNFKILMDRYGEISEKLTIILETLIKESRETREMINENIKLVKKAVEKLSTNK